MSKYRIANARNSKCERCGGILFYNISKGKFECTHCGELNKIMVEHKLEKIPFDFTNISKEVPDYSIDVISCHNCNAEIVLDDELDITGVCPYCDSNYVSDFSKKRLIVPTAVIPYKIGKEEAKDRFKKWLKKLKGEKRGFTKSVINCNIVQTYRPFWIYNADLVIEYKFDDRVIMDGRTVILNKNEIEVINLVNVGIDAMYNTSYVDRIEPERKSFQKFNFDELVEYDDAFLTGTQTYVYSLDIIDGLDTTKALIGSALAQKHKDTARDFIIKQAKNSGYSLALLPVWEARMVYNSEVYIYSLNAQTGREFGEYPKNWLLDSSRIKVKMR